MTPRRIQLSRKKGWRKPAGAVVVARPSKWGNHWRVGTPPERPANLGECFFVPTAEEAVANYRAYLESHPQIVEDARRELRGKDLCCWCEPGAPCHADVLLQVANSGSSVQRECESPCCRGRRYGGRGFTQGSGRSSSFNQHQS